MVLLAEGEGFKPPIPERGIPDFESSAIDHSANLPKCQTHAPLVWNADAKVIQIPDSTKGITGKLQKLFERELLEAVTKLFGFRFADA